MLKEFNVVDGKAVSNTPISNLLKPPKQAWVESDDSSESRENTTVVPPPQDKFVCEVLIRRSQDEDCILLIVSRTGCLGRSK